MASLRILWLSYYYLPHVGGGSWATYFLSEILSSKGHQIDLIVPNIQFTLSISAVASQELQSKNLSTLHRVPQIKLPRLLGPFASFFPMFLSGLKHGKKAEVIICQFHPFHFTTFCAVLLGRVFKVPVIARADDIHRDMGSQSAVESMLSVSNTFNESLVGYTRFFLVTCLDHKSTLTERIGQTHSSRILVEFNGFDASEFNNLPSISEARKCLGLPQNQKILLFIGRFSGTEYEIDVLLNAFASLSQQKSNVLLLLVGDELTVSQHSLIDALSISKSTKVYGAVPKEKIVKFIAASDICIGPIGPTRAIPLKILEYMACGKPIVTGEDSVSSDLNPKMNFVETPPDSKALCQALLRVLDDPVFAQNLSLRAKEASKQFTWQISSEHLEGLLMQTAKPK